jgi:CrcB protein
MHLFWIGVGGCLGAIARYLLGGIVTQRMSASAFPWGTFVVNVSGCLLLGFFGALAWARLGWPPVVRLGLLTGFLGAYTTFSTWNMETFQLLQAGNFWRAGLNLLGSATAGLVATWLGFALGKSV